jgi:DNA-binding NarL/FixJ family response regulator
MNRQFDGIPRSSPWDSATPQEIVPFPIERSGDRESGVPLVLAAAEARSALREAATAAAEAAARAQAIAAALDEALAVLDVAREAAAAPSLPFPAALGIETLSRREREVHALVAEGRSNKAIADALYVSPNTVKTHVASLLSKLQAETRAQLAAIAARQPAA